MITPDSWVLPEKPHFKKWIHDTFKDDPDKSGNLFSHQRFIRNFMQEKSPYQGLLLYHGLGVGKSRSAILVAMENVGTRKVVVLLPASLQANFELEMTAFADPPFDVQFVKYNGLNQKNVEKIGSFDNKLIIIDEVHNFISRVSGEGPICKKVYDKIMQAKNVRIIALSGTPIINRPFELGLLLNLIHGHIWTDTWETKQKFSEALIEKVESSPHTRFSKCTSKKIDVVMLPTHFVRDGDVEGESSGNVIWTPSKKVHDVVSEAAKLLHITVPESTRSYHPIYPQNSDEFDEMYVDYQNKTSKSNKTKEFQSKIQGLVSYFESYDLDSYPQKMPLQIVHLQMKSEQLVTYVEVRVKEIDNEIKSKRNDQDDMKTAGSIYRTFSRSICNFAFPDSIKRPYPSTIKKNLFNSDIDIDTGIETAVGKEDTISNAYQNAIKDALDQLKERADEFLSPSGLDKYGPKMKEIIKRIGESVGTSLVYSVFRNVEGLKILSMAMDYAGYTELNVEKNKKSGEWQIKVVDFNKPKYILFTDDREKTNILMHMFNSEFHKLPESIQTQLTQLKVDTNLRGEFIKTLMITQSGSEGISLKNVRQVHIMEPYWNDIRIQQVIGRAVRANSHIKLEKKERIVETFMYVMTLNPKDLGKEQAKIKGTDGNKTSDGYILEIADKKSALTNHFLNLVKESAVDCELNQVDHEYKIMCFDELAKQKQKSKDKSEEDGDGSSSLFVTMSHKQNPEMSWRYCSNPTEEEKEAYLEVVKNVAAGFKTDKTNEGFWTGMYPLDNFTQEIGFVLIVNGLPTKMTKIGAHQKPST